MKVISIKTHEYASKMREPGDEYEAEDRFVGTFLLPLGRVRVVVPENRMLDAEPPRKKRGRPYKVRA